jgi:hypothetical protein
MSDRERFETIIKDNLSRQRYVEQYLGRFPQEPHIQREIGEKAMEWEYVLRDRPAYLILGINSFLRLYDVFRDELGSAIAGRGRGRYMGMTIIVIPVEEFVEVSDGCDWSKARYVQERRPHMGKKESESEDDETRVSEGPGGTGPDDGTLVETKVA